MCKKHRGTAIGGDPYIYIYICILGGFKGVRSPNLETIQVHLNILFRAFFAVITPNPKPINVGTGTHEPV